MSEPSLSSARSLFFRPLPKSQPISCFDGVKRAKRAKMHYSCNAKWAHKKGRALTDPPISVVEEAGDVRLNFVGKIERAR
jgi:hypothetical protein